MHSVAPAGQIKSNRSPYYVGDNSVEQEFTPLVFYYSRSEQVKEFVPVAPANSIMFMLKKRGDK